MDKVIEAHNKYMESVLPLSVANHVAKQQGQLVDTTSADLKLIVKDGLNEVNTNLGKIFQAIVGNTKHMVQTLVTTDKKIYDKRSIMEKAMMVLGIKPESKIGQTLIQKQERNLFIQQGLRDESLRTDPLLKGKSEKETTEKITQYLRTEYDSIIRKRKELAQIEEEISQIQTSGITAESTAKGRKLLQARDQLQRTLERRDDSKYELSEKELEAEAREQKMLDLLEKIEVNTRGGFAGIKGGLDAGVAGAIGAGGGTLSEMIRAGLYGMVTAMILSIRTAFTGALRFMGSSLLLGLRSIFSVGALVPLLSRIFVPTLIIGSIVGAVAKGFEEWKESGSLSEAIVEGLGGALKFLTVGLLDADSIRKVMSTIESYVITPIKEYAETVKELFSTYITEPFKKYVYTPTLEAINAIKSSIAKVKEMIEGFEIPGISFNLPNIGEFKFGPWRPFSTPEPLESQTPSEKMLIEGVRNFTPSESIPLSTEDIEFINRVVPPVSSSVVPEAPKTPAPHVWQQSSDNNVLRSAPPTLVVPSVTNIGPTVNQSRNSISVRGGIRNEDPTVRGMFSPRGLGPSQ